MSKLHIGGIVWEVSGKKDGKGILHHQDCTVSFDKSMGVFQFKQGSNLILAREMRGDCLRDATECILDSYASQFVPSWEIHDGTAQKAA